MLRIGVTLALLGLLASRLDPSGLTVRWDRRLLLGFLAAVALLLFTQWLSALRWRLVLGREAPGTTTLFRITLAGMFFGLFLPTSVGGDAVRALYVSRIVGQPARAASGVLLDRFLGLVAMALILAAGVLISPALSARVLGQAEWGWGFPWWWWGLAALALVAIAWAAGRLLQRAARVRGLVLEAAAVWTAFGSRRLALGTGMLVAGAVQLSYVLTWVELAWVLRLPVPLADFLLFVPLVSLAGMLPISISGLGLREGAWALLLVPYGVAAEDAVAFSLLYFTAFALVGALGGGQLALRGVAPSRPSAGALPARSDGMDNPGAVGRPAATPGLQLIEPMPSGTGRGIAR